MLALKCRCNEGFEERVRAADRGPVFRVKLHTHKPRMVGKFYDFNEIAGRV